MQLIPININPLLFTTTLGLLLLNIKLMHEHKLFQTSKPLPLRKLIKLVQVLLRQGLNDLFDITGALLNLSCAKQFLQNFLHFVFI